jgi:hypothetical protein
VAWVPVAFALEASAALPRLVTYGWPGALVLAARVLATGLGIAAGRALWRVEPHARRLAQAWLVLDVAVTWLTLATPYFPSNRLPGTRAWEMAGVVALDGAWLVYLATSSRVRACWTSRALREASTGGDDGLL